VTAGEILSLLETLSSWASVPGVKVYLYGSRARGDNRPDSDVDVYVEFGSGVTGATVEWWMRHNETDFADLMALLPGRLELLDGPDKLKRDIASAPVLASSGNAFAVLLPAGPNKVPL
jgi:predicted nucleotidyltransferase